MLPSLNLLYQIKHVCMYVCMYVYMTGTVNGHYFEVEGDGKGKPYE